MFESSSPPSPLVFHFPSLSFFLSGYIARHTLMVCDIANVLRGQLAIQRDGTNNCKSECELDSRISRSIPEDV